MGLVRKHQEVHVQPKEKENPFVQGFYKKQPFNIQSHEQVFW